MALLLSVLDFVSRHKDRSTLVGTDITCKWDKPRKQSVPIKINDIDFRRQTGIAIPPAPKVDQFTPIPEQSNAVNVKLETDMVKLLKSQNSNAVFLHLLSDSDDSSQTESEDETELPNMVDVHRQYNDLCEKPSVITFIRDTCNKAYRDKVETETSEQTASEKWKAQRLGRITASVAHSVLHAKQETLVNPDSYIVGNIMQCSSFTSQSTEYGQRSESIAKQLYKDLEKNHTEFRFKDSGLVIDTNHPFLGASPDGIASCTCCGHRLIEIKCPFAFKDMTIEQICMQPGYHLQMKDGSVSCKPSAPWYTQMQMQMHVTKYSSCHLVIYTQLPPFIHVIPVEYNKEFIDSMLPILCSFFQKTIWPLLDM